MRGAWFAALTWAAALGLVGCQAVAPRVAAAPTTAVLPPGLAVEGVPPVPLSLARQTAPYTDLRGHTLADWHPTAREMLVSHRAPGTATAQLYRLTGPLGDLQALTHGADPVTRARYEPLGGSYVVFERAAGGSEVTQLYRLDAPGAEPVALTAPDERHALLTWLNTRSELIHASVPLDRTAVGGSRAQVNTTLWLLDPLHPDRRRRLAVLPGPGWYTARTSRDDRWLALGRYRSANASEIWLLDLSSGERRRVLPADPAPMQATHAPLDFSADGRYLYLLTDRHGEFRELARLEIADGRLERISHDTPWDITEASLSPDGREVVALANVAGRRELRRYSAATLAPLPAPGLPVGSLAALRHHRVSGELALVATHARAPGQVWSVAPGRAAQAWTQPSVPAGLDTASFTEQQVVRWRTFDGLEISGLLTLPPPRHAGRRPVLVLIHGGPEAQASVGFLGRTQYYAQELGVAIVQPNVRGSSGFGKRFLTLDNGRQREDAVRDIGALLDWIATQPQLDPARVLVSGGSYGGYMSLAVAARYPERIVGAIDVVGISHFLTFLKNTESYRRDLRRVEYGDEREPGMAEFLDRISPLTQAHRITRPLMVVQGRNDPRVPYTEAEQIVQRVRANGTTVWYLRAENEGHGFARQANQDYQFWATVLFMQHTLLR
jgi:dipeptidyl aminopeptidase/acylaminoacyl peptidase